MKVLPLRILLLLAINNKGISYKELSKVTGFHINTISRSISKLYEDGLIEIRQEKGNSTRGKKWINIVRLKPEFYEDQIISFFSKISKQLGCQLNDLIIT